MKSHQFFFFSFNFENAFKRHILIEKQVDFIIINGEQE